MSSVATPPLTGLPRRLVLDNALTEEQAIKSRDRAREKKQPLVAYLIENKILAAAKIASAAAHEFGMPMMDISAVSIDQAPLDAVNDSLLRKHQVLPIFRRGNALYVAVADPTNIGAVDEIKFHTGLNTEAIIVEADKLERVLESALDRMDTSMAGLADSDLDNLQVEDADDTPDEDITRSDIEDAPVVRFVHKILLDAINKGASDVHFEPYEKTYRVRYRQDGMLHEVAAPPVGLGSRLAARLKVMARLDIAERRVPQDGRIKLALSRNRAIDFRMNTCPTLYGEKIVLRILDPNSAKLGVDALGFEPEQKKLFLDAISKPWGLVLVTGPTGSGKTVSLYTGLNILNEVDRNISTAEDPVEIQVPGINQVNVSAKVGFTFAEALRAFLRQDPDVIMVGEIRDLETAEIAIKAAQTGHMVLSTLHTNDAPQTLSRLLNMGIPGFNIASAVSLIIAQRLARRLCEHCKEHVDIPDHALEEIGFTAEEVSDGLELYGPTGCDRCTGGYKGRVGLYQVMPMSEGMKAIIMRGGNAIELAEQSASEGVNDLRRSALNKVKQGVTSLEEMNRVTAE